MKMTPQKQGLNRLCSHSFLPSTFFSRILNNLNCIMRLQLRQRQRKKPTFYTNFFNDVLFSPEDESWLLSVFFCSPLLQAAVSLSNCRTWPFEEEDVVKKDYSHFRRSSIAMHCAKRRMCVPTWHEQQQQQLAENIAKTHCRWVIVICTPLPPPPRRCALKGRGGGWIMRPARKHFARATLLSLKM